MNTQEGAGTAELWLKSYWYAIQVCTQKSWDKLMAKFAELPPELPEEALTQIFQVKYGSPVLQCDIFAIGTKDRPADINLILLWSDLPDPSECCLYTA